MCAVETEEGTGRDAWPGQIENLSDPNQFLPLLSATHPTVASDVFSAAAYKWPFGIGTCAREDGSEAGLREEVRGVYGTIGGQRRATG
jgi:hypothetical protein